MSAIKCWCFTLNNPAGLLTYDPSWQTTLVYQEEIGDSGTHHFQGYVETTSRMRLAQVKAAFNEPTIHLEPRRGSRRQAMDYCRKEPRVGGPYEYGDYALPTQGARTDVNDFLDAVADGMDFDASFDAFPSIHARFPRFVADAFERRRIAALPPLLYTPRPGWQTTLSGILAQQPDLRKVHWFVDDVGNSGKSWTAHHLNPTPYVITGGRQADIFYAYSFQSVVIFDWPREAEDRFPYAVVEAFKNGYFLNTKYVSRSVRFAPPHVIVFSNSAPDRSKLSLDRWDVHNIINFP